MVCHFLLVSMVSQDKSTVIESLFSYSYCVFLWLPSRLLFCIQQFDSDALGHRFLWVYPFLNFLSFLSFYVYFFFPGWGVFSHYFFKKFFLFPHPLPHLSSICSGIAVAYILDNLILPHRLLMPLIFPLVFFSLRILFWILWCPHIN